MNAALRRLATALAATVVTLVVAQGVAAAWYTAFPATGTGTATTLDTSATLALTVTGTAGALYPGGPAADMTVSVANPYAYAVTLIALAPAGAATATPLAGRTCAAYDVALATPTGLPATVPALSSGTTVVLGGAVTMAAAENGCQGATFAVPLRLTGRLS